MRFGRALHQRRFGLVALLVGLAAIPFAVTPNRQLLLLDQGLSGSISTPVGEGEPSDPLRFSASELLELKRRFGVHGPQPRLAQLFTSGIDQLEPLRTHTVGRIADLQPLIIAECRRQRVGRRRRAAGALGERIARIKNNGAAVFHELGNARRCRLRWQGLVGGDWPVNDGEERQLIAGGVDAHGLGWRKRSALSQGARQRGQAKAACLVDLRIACDDIRESCLQRSVQHLLVQRGAGGRCALRESGRIVSRENKYEASDKR